MPEPASKSNQENGMYYPSPDIVSSSYIRDFDILYDRSITNPQEFWAERAEELEWFQKWDKVLDD